MADLDQIFKDCKRRKMKSVSPVQTAAMLDFLERHPELAVNKCRSNAGTLWAECADILNAFANKYDGPTRTGAQWSKFFSDLKYRARRKALELKIAEGSSGPGEEMAPLTPSEDRLLSLIGEKGMWATVVKGGTGVEDDPLYVSDSEEEGDFGVSSDRANKNNSANSIEHPMASKTDEKISNDDTVATETDKTNEVATKSNKIDNKRHLNTAKSSVKDGITATTDKMYNEDSNSKNAGVKILKDGNSSPLDVVETRENRKRRREDITEKNNDGYNNERPQMNGNGHSDQDYDQDDDDSWSEMFLRLEERKVANLERISDALLVIREELKRAVDVLMHR